MGARDSHAEGSASSGAENWKTGILRAWPVALCGRFPDFQVHLPNLAPNGAQQGPASLAPPRDRHPDSPSVCLVGSKTAFRTTAHLP